MLKRCAHVLLMAAVVLLGLGSADAGPANLNHLLKGDYAFSGHATCLNSPGGFNPNLTPVGPPLNPTAPFPTVTSFSIQGVRTFNGDETGTVVARSVGMNHPFALPPSFFNRGGAFSTDVESTFTYEVAPDRTFTIETPAVTATSVLPVAGNVSTITDLPVFSGAISQDHRTLTIHHDEPGVEKVTPASGPVGKRICIRSRIHLELKGGK